MSASGEPTEDDAQQLVHSRETQQDATPAQDVVYDASATAVNASVVSPIAVPFTALQTASPPMPTTATPMLRDTSIVASSPSVITQHRLAGSEPGSRRGSDAANYGTPQHSSYRAPSGSRDAASTGLSALELEPQQHSHQRGPPSPRGTSSGFESVDHSDVMLLLSRGTSREEGSLGVAADTDVYTFGQNAYGELGLGDTLERQAPSLVEMFSGKRVCCVAAGNEHTAVLCEDGSVFSVGYNDSGQCGVGHLIKLSEPTLVSALVGKDIVSVHSANGCEHLLAVSDDGSLYACGYNVKGQLGLGDTSVVTIPKPVEGLFGKRVVQVACSYYHTVVGTAAGEVYAFGRNDYGQLGTGDSFDSAVPRRVEAFTGDAVLSMACGQYHTCVSIERVGVYSWGKNDYGQLGLNSIESRNTPAKVSEPLADQVVVLLRAGYYHTLALTVEGQVFSFGRNDFGQLGLDHNRSVKKPQIVAGLAGHHIVQISCGSFHSLALTEEGKVFTFGRNNHGQLGLGTTVDQCSPQVISSLADRGLYVIGIAGGFYHSICLVRTGMSALAGGASTSSLHNLHRDRPTSLAGDLARLLNNPARSDVTFIVENRPIYGHRCVIMVRCEPLAAMLDGCMRESQQEEIVLPDQRYHVFLAFLEFLYTDRVQVMDPLTESVEFAMDLLSVADQYMVDQLKKVCEAAIQKSVSIENVAVMFKIADCRRASTLRHRCYEYILRHFGKVIGTPAFAELPPHLLQEVLQSASKRGAYLRS